MEELRPLTREEKLKIYTLAKETFIDYTEKRDFNGMCYHINLATVRLDLKHDVYCYTKKHFPEFYALKKKRSGGLYWWKLENTKIRIKKFDLLIQQLSQIEV